MINIENLSAAQRKELMLTEADIQEIERARKMPIVFDEDSPETTHERTIKFRRANPPREHKKNAF